MCLLVTQRLERHTAGKVCAARGGQAQGCGRYRSRGGRRVLAQRRRLQIELSVAVQSTRIPCLALCLLSLRLQLRLRLRLRLHASIIA